MRTESENNSPEKSRSGPKTMHFAMMACCVVMAVPVVGFFLAGGTLGISGSSVMAFAPLVLCVGAHLVMHKMMGKSCHSKASEHDAEDIKVVAEDVVSTVPQVRRG